MVKQSVSDKRNAVEAKEHTNEEIFIERQSLMKLP